MQIVDAALPPDANVAKEARLALSSSASCFVHYITALCALSLSSSPGLAVMHSWGWCRAWDCCKQRQKKVRFRTERGWLRSPRSTRLRRLIPSGRSARGGCVEQVLGPEDVLEAMKEAQLLPFRCLSNRPVSRPTRTHARARAAHALTRMGMVEDGGGKGSDGGKESGQLARERDTTR
jgi:hypothetical protein